jgi:hypothetical protein
MTEGDDNPGEVEGAVVAFDGTIEPWELKTVAVELTEAFCDESSVEVDDRI